MCHVNVNHESSLKFEVCFTPIKLDTNLKVDQCKKKLDVSTCCVCALKVSPYLSAVLSGYPQCGCTKQLLARGRDGAGWSRTYRRRFDKGPQGENLSERNV